MDAPEHDTAARDAAGVAAALALSASNDARQLESPMSSAGHGLRSRADLSQPSLLFNRLSLAGRLSSVRGFRTAAIMSFAAAAGGHGRGERAASPRLVTRSMSLGVSGLVGELASFVSFDGLIWPRDGFASIASAAIAPVRLSSPDDASPRAARGPSRRHSSRNKKTVPAVVLHCVPARLRRVRRRSPRGPAIAIEAAMERGAR